MQWLRGRLFMCLTPCSPLHLQSLTSLTQIGIAHLLSAAHTQLPPYYYRVEYKTNSEKKKLYVLYIHFNRYFQGSDHSTGLTPDACAHMNIYVTDVICWQIHRDSQWEQILLLQEENRIPITTAETKHFFMPFQRNKTPLPHPSKNPSRNRKSDLIYKNASTNWLDHQRDHLHKDSCHSKLSYMEHKRRYFEKENQFFHTKEVHVDNVVWLRRFCFFLCSIEVKPSVFVCI